MNFNINISFFQPQFEGQNLFTLTISNSTQQDSGIYICIAKNPVGETQSSCVVNVIPGEGPLQAPRPVQVMQAPPKQRFTVSEPDMSASDVETQRPKFIKPLLNAYVLEGNKAKLDCVVVGTPEPEVSLWTIHYNLCY